MKGSTPLPITTIVPRSGFRILLRLLLWCCGWLAVGAVLTILAYQVPARHRVEVGYNDAAYVQGFGEAINRWGVVTDQTGMREPYRWSGLDSALIFPQIGLPARATIHWRAYRPAGAPLPRVRVLLNGREELGVFQATGYWEEHTFAIRGGLWKPRDLFLRIVVEPPVEIDGAQRGVQIDRALLETTGWPILPYPAQVLGSALATLLAAVSLRRRAQRLAVVAAMPLLFLICYRLQIAPYPARIFWPAMIGLWALIGAISASSRLAGRTGDASILRLAGRARVIDAFAVAAIVLWASALWWAGRSHVVLSVPGVENDFRVFATRSNALVCPPGARLADANCVLRPDGFYQLGYPLLLWLARPFTGDNAFLAAQLVALACAVALLSATYLLARRLLGPLAAILALGFVLLNRWTVEYALLLGTDMPFAAAWVAGLAALTLARRPRQIFVAGLLCGLAYLIRHPGILLLPLGILFSFWSHRRRGLDVLQGVSRLRVVGLLVAGFTLTSLPQIVVNLVGAGSPFYSQQAKNIWLAVYGNTDWNHWGEASNDVKLVDVIAQDPGRFAANWWANVRGFWGSGSADMTEFGQALGLRLLTFPANLLAFAGLLWWLLRGDRRDRFLLLAALLYVGGIAVGFMLPRFALPLVPIWAIAAAAALYHFWRMHAAALPRQAYRHWLAALSLVALLLLQVGAPSAAIRGVVERQDRDAVAAVVLLRGTLGPRDRLVFDLPAGDPLGKYSAVAHLGVPESTPSAPYLLTTHAPPARARLLGRAGRYALYSLNS